MALHFEGTQQIKASQEKVWQFVLDPNKVAECAPGFKSMEILADDHFKPTIAVGIGAVKATFTLDVKLEDVTPQTHAAMRGRGNAAGSAVDMKAAMSLTPVSADETTMAWTADVNVSGTIASVGARLMEGTANKLTAQFFDCFRQKLEASAEVEQPAEAETPEASGS
jgi:carbon monoxide dehydrogenase subunit G